MWREKLYLYFASWKLQEWYIYLMVWDFTSSVKVLKSQVLDKKPINNPIQGRCY